MSEDMDGKERLDKILSKIDDLRNELSEEYISIWAEAYHDARERAKVQNNKDDEQRIKLNQFYGQLSMLDFEKLMKKGWIPKVLFHSARCVELKYVPSFSCIEAGYEVKWLNSRRIYFCFDEEQLSKYIDKRDKKIKNEKNKAF